MKPRNMSPPQGPAQYHQHSHDHSQCQPQPLGTSLPSDSVSATTSASSSAAWNIIKNPSSGRTRISQACDRCRARKIKCSGKSETSPRCTNCQKDGFQCVVSDKLTRNSFPKGYTKNLEKKLLEVELDRNRLQLELKELRAQLGRQDDPMESASDSSVSPHSASIAVKSEQVNVDALPVNAAPTASASATPADLASAVSATSISAASVSASPASFASAVSSSNGAAASAASAAAAAASASAVSGAATSSSCTSESNAAFKPALISSFNTDEDGQLAFGQFMVFPFNKLLKKLEINSFNGYEPSSASSDKKSGPKSEQYVYGGRDDPETLILMNYHLNLNRYLNLVLYKLIFPAFSVGTASNSKGKLSSNGKNLDHLIWLFFNVYNKLIPILDFELFYNDYLTFINKYTVKNSTYIENGEAKKRYYEFTTKEQDLLIKLILILKFTTTAPKGAATSSIPDRHSFNQLEESIKLINLKNLKMMIRGMNFTTDVSMDKYEISLMLFYYLLKFENYNAVPESLRDTSRLKFRVNLLRDVGQLCDSLNDRLHFSRNSANLKLASKTGRNEQVVKIQRLKLYWDYQILTRLAEVYFNVDLASLTPKRDFGKLQPQSLESIKVVSPDIEITFQLKKLLDIIPKNLLALCVANNKTALKEVNNNLTRWCEKVDAIQTEENAQVITKLKTYYHYFKILIHLNGSSRELRNTCISFLNSAYGLIFDELSDVSLENAENLSLHSFNFHLISMITLIKLGSSSKNSRELTAKIIKVAKLYQVLISVKNVDPLIQDLARYLFDNILATPTSKNNSGATAGPSEIAPKDDLALFAYTMAPSGSSSGSSAFLRNAPSARKMAFEYTGTEGAGSSSRKRRSSDSPESESSAYSKRLSISSNDTATTTVPSLFGGVPPADLVAQKRPTASYEAKPRAMSDSVNQAAAKPPLSKEPSMTNLFREINVSLGLGEFAEDDKKKLNISTIPSETNLADSLTDGSFFEEGNSISAAAPAADVGVGSPKRSGVSTEDLSELMTPDASSTFGSRMNAFRDDDDLLKLKERVLNMKSRASTTMG